jgi:hypothetical protein
MFKNIIHLTAAYTAVLFASSLVMAVDFEAFEFNEANFTELQNAVNTNTGNNWSVDIDDLTDSYTDGAGSYRIAKFNDAQADNYLQIANVDPNTSGSRYIVARMSGWDFYDSVPGLGEQIRFDFLDNDTGTSGSTITAQVRIDRNTDPNSGLMELRGTAIGVGSQDIANRATLNTTQNAPFTMVLELNKTSNTYEVFYKDGSNPSQSLGSAPVAPIRNGNSVRFGVWYNFGSDIDEYFAIDRFAVTDTNPLTDLLTLEIDRVTGVMRLINPTGAPLTGLESYSITSASGAIIPANWKPITDNYDRAAGPGDGSVDLDNDWSIDVSTAYEISESVDSGDGGILATNPPVTLSMGSGPWIRSPFEDLEITLNFIGAPSRRANVNFVGNGDKRLPVGDLNGSGTVTVADWTQFISGAETDLSALSPAQAYQQGDLNGDGENNIFDFGLFKDAYEAANGLGAFEAMLAGVPEPSCLLLFGAGTALLITRRRRIPAIRVTQVASDPIVSNRDSWGKSMNSMHRVYIPFLAVLFSLGLADFSESAVLQDFQFNDTNGTLLASTANSVPLGNTWNEDTVDMNFSSVQGGVYRIQKNTATTPSGFGTNFLDIDNISSGKAWLVAEIAGWHFSSIAGTDEFDSGQLEEIRFDFLDNDGSDQGGSTVTAEVEIERIANGTIQILGAALGTGSPIAAQSLPLTQSDPFTVVLALDKDVNTYEIFTKNGANPFVSLSGAPVSIDTTRSGNSIRFIANNSFAGTSEHFSIDRIYLTDTDPVNVAADKLTLQVNLTTGTSHILNDTATTFEINSYRLFNELPNPLFNFSNWTSFSDRNLDAIDGPDVDDTEGNGIGETWDEAAGSSNNALAESFLLGSSEFTNGRSERLGKVFDTSADPNAIMFQYRDANSGAVVEGNIVFVTTDADFNGDNSVDGRDFLIWQRNVGVGGQINNSNGDADGSGVVDQDDLFAWEDEYGAVYSPLSAASTAVPEPAACSLLLMATTVVLMKRRRRESSCDHVSNNWRSMS